MSRLRRNQPISVATLALLGVVSAAPLLAIACSNNGDQTSFDTTSTNAGSGASSPSGTGGTTNTGGSTGVGLGGSLFDAGPPSADLAISPLNPKIKVELPLTGQTLQFQCLNTTTMTPVANATWTLSVPDLGTISATGLFTPNGIHTGEATVTCALNQSTASTKVDVFVHAMDNTAGITPAQQAILKAPGAGASDPQWQWLYPYDKTVFPKGILAPEIQLAQGSMLANVFYVHIVAPTYEYEGWFNSPPNLTNLKMSQNAWDSLTNSAAGAKVEVQISKLANGMKVGPIFRDWVLANGNLHGTVYYNTYDSMLPGANGGAMIKIKGNSPTPDLLIGNCTVCHSISSDGSTAAAANHSGQGGVFDITVSPPVNSWVDAEDAAFAGLFPNGSVLVTNGAPGPNYPPNTPGTSGTWFSSLRTKAGTVIPNSGIESYYAQSPIFAHDGTKLAFTDRKQNGANWGSVLAMFDYDAMGQKFSNYQVLGTPPATHHYAWPAFTPDNKWVLYQNGVGEDLATWDSNTAKIYMVNVQSKVITFLENLNGDGYMPAGARDENLNFEPTIAPIASGGYFWIMFTSRRTYGNKLTGDRSVTKRLWVSAFDPTAKDSVDPTHPAFYIAGQELTSGNSRGFWALDPCKKDGSGCVTGDECCTGFCNSKGNPPQFLCGPPDGSCSKEFENCATAADCCDKSLECIGGKCSQLPPN